MDLLIDPDLCLFCICFNIHLQIQHLETIKQDETICKLEQRFHL